MAAAGLLAGKSKSKCFFLSSNLWNTTVGFGKYDKKEKEWDFEINIRELSIIEAGIGCAIWDASIILSRFIFDSLHEKIRNKRVLELGSGVGLPGIMAARYAREVYMSDFIDQV